MAHRNFSFSNSLLGDDELLLGFKVKEKMSLELLCKKLEIKLCSDAADSSSVNTSAHNLMKDFLQEDMKKRRTVAIVDRLANRALSSSYLCSKSDTLKLALKGLQDYAHYPFIKAFSASLKGTLKTVTVNKYQIVSPNYKFRNTKSSPSYRLTVDVSGDKNRLNLTISKLYYINRVLYYVTNVSGNTLHLRLGHSGFWRVDRGCVRQETQRLTLAPALSPLHGAVVSGNRFIC